MKPAKNKLAVATPTDLCIVLTRRFDAPRQRVWDAMSKPDLIRRWLFLPPGWTMTLCEEDPRPGGKFRWQWAGPDGNTAMVLTGVYREFLPPLPDGSGGRSVRTEAFEVGCQPMGEQLCTLQLTPDGDATLLTLTILFASKEARDGMLGSGMEGGMSAGYDQLDAMLDKGF